MKRFITVTALLIIAMMTAIGCSTSGNAPTDPGEPELQIVYPDDGRQILGAWKVVIDTVNRTVISEPVRTGMAHIPIIIEPDFESAVEDALYNIEFSIWNMNIEIVNTTGMVLYDVRGIVQTEMGALDLHEADGRVDYPDISYIECGNPFMSYGEVLPVNGEASAEFNVECIPAFEQPLECWNMEDPKPGDIPPPVEYIEFVFYLDGCDAPCDEPYRIDNFNQTMIPMGGTGTLSVDVFDHQGDVIAAVLVLPEPWWSMTEMTYVDGNTWEIEFTVPPEMRDSIFDAYIMARSFGVPPFDHIFKDIRIKIGDWDQILDQTFDPVTIEVDDVYADWSNRDINNPVSHGIHHGQIHEAFTGDFGVYGTWNCYHGSHIMMPEGIEHHGAVLFPDTGDDLPILLWTHFGRFVMTKPNQFMIPDEIIENGECVILLPAYRGNPLCFNGIAYPDTEFYPEINSPGNYDVDDALTFLEGVIMYSEYVQEGMPGYDDFTRLDYSKVAVMGGSRGGSPSYLAAVRDPWDRITGAVISCGSVTDFLHENPSPVQEDYLKAATRLYIDNDLVPENGSGGLWTYVYYNENYNFFKRFVDYLIEGEMTVFEGRKRALFSSPGQFFDDVLLELPPIVVHHGTEDLFVNFEQSEWVSDYPEDIIKVYQYNVAAPGTGGHIPSYTVPPVGETDTYPVLIRDFLRDVAWAD